MGRNEFQHRIPLLPCLCPITEAKSYTRVFYNSSAKVKGGKGSKMPWDCFRRQIFLGCKFMIAFFSLPLPSPGLDDIADNFFPNARCRFTVSRFTLDKLRFSATRHFYTSVYFCGGLCQKNTIEGKKLLGDRRTLYEIKIFFWLSARNVKILSKIWISRHFLTLFVNKVSAVHPFTKRGKFKLE